MHFLDSPSRQRRFIRTGARIVLFAALLPSISYVGHWPFGPGASHVDTPAEAEAHAAHCHSSASQCTGQAAMVGTWWIGEGEPLAMEGNNPHLVEPDASHKLPEPVAGRLTPPPRSV